MYDKVQVLDKNTLSFDIKTKDNDHYYIMNDFYMLMNKNEANKLNIKVILNDDDSYVNVIFDDKVLHRQKLYKLSYKQRMTSLKELLFSK